jgi:hypothetical protein
MSDNELPQIQESDGQDDIAVVVELVYSRLETNKMNGDDGHQASTSTTVI